MTHNPGGASAGLPCVGVVCFLHTHLLSPFGEEAGDPLTGGSVHRELGELGGQGVWSNGVKIQGKVSKQDSGICAEGLVGLNTCFSKDFITTDVSAICLYT